jgi:hypothetical protein
VPAVGLLYAVTAIALGMGVVSLCTLGLGLAGMLTRATAFGLLALGILAGILAILLHSRRRKAAREDDNHDEHVSAWWRGHAGWAWAGLVVAPWLALAVVGTMMVPGLLWKPGEPHGYDVVEYHLQVPREWYEAGRIMPLHHNVFSYFPFNVEMHYLLAMHLRGGPWAGMYLAQMMHGLFFVLAVVAICGFANRSTKPTRAPGSGAVHRMISPLVAVVALASTPWVPQLGAIAYDEGGFVLFGLLAIGWALRALRDPDQPLRSFALSGGFAGLACGAKLTAVPEVLLAVPLAAAVVLFRRGGRIAPQTRHWVAGPVLCGIVGLLVFSPWLIRTAAWSHGNPVYPELTSVLGRGDFDDAQIQRWHNAHSARADQRSLPARLHAGWTEVIANWQFAYLLIPAALAGIVVTFGDPQTRFLALVLLALAIVWLFFTHLQGRFFILAAPVCALLFARLPTRAALPIVLAQAVLTIVLLNQHLLARIVPEALGMEDLGPFTHLSFLPAGQEQQTQNAPLALVGDERPFVYQRPMSLLTYRTVFDVKGDRGDVIEAFAGAKPTGPQWLLISPDELQRFSRTYQPFPPVPPQVAAHQQPYLIAR